MNRVEQIWNIHVKWSIQSRVSTKHIRTLGDVSRFRHRVRITCGVCDKVSVVDPMALLRTVPSNLPLDALSRKLRCSTCGQRNAKVEIVD